MMQLARFFSRLWPEGGKIAHYGVPETERLLIAEIRSKKLTYLSDAKLACLANACRQLQSPYVEGLFVEAGCALGGSAILLSRLKGPGRKLTVYDVFGMIPAPTSEDTEDVHDRYGTICTGKSKGIAGDKYYGYEENLYELVHTNLASFNINLESDKVELVRGLLQETMRIEQPIALAHIDVDWYEPVMTCLIRIVPNLAVGGILVLDDYHDWGGCKKAVDEYFRDCQGEFEMDDSAGSMRIVRRSIS